MSEYEWLKTQLHALGVGKNTDIQEVLIENMIPRFKEFLVLKLAENIEPKDVEVLQSMMTFTPESVEIMTFFEDLIPNLDQKLLEYIKAFEQVLNESKS